MKKLIFILFVFIGLSAVAQTPLKFANKYVWQVWKGDTIKTTLYGDSTLIWATSAKYILGNYTYLQKYASPGGADTLLLWLNGTTGKIDTMRMSSIVAGSALFADSAAVSNNAWNLMTKDTTEIYEGAAGQTGQCNTAYRDTVRGCSQDWVNIDDSLHVMGILDLDSILSIDGARTLYQNAGRLNLFGGYNAGISCTGAGNTAFGYNSMFKTTSGIENAAYGTGSLLNNIGGSANTAIGYSSLGQNYFGEYNTAVGKDALLGLTGNYNIGLGNAAGGSTYDSLDYRLYINSISRGGKKPDSTRSIIYGKQNADSTLQHLWLNANIHIGGNYVLPFTDGLLNQVLTTNGAGVTSWQTLSGFDSTHCWQKINTDSLASCSPMDIKADQINIRGEFFNSFGGQQIINDTNFSTSTSKFLGFSTLNASPDSTHTGYFVGYDGYSGIPTAIMLFDSTQWTGSRMHIHKSAQIITRKDYNASSVTNEDRTGTLLHNALGLTFVTPDTTVTLFEDTNGHFLSQTGIQKIINTQNWDGSSVKFTGFTDYDSVFNNTTRRGTAMGIIPANRWGGIEFDSIKAGFIYHSNTVNVSPDSVYLASIDNNRTTMFTVADSSIKLKIPTGVELFKVSGNELSYKATAVGKFRFDIGGNGLLLSQNGLMGNTTKAFKIDGAYNITTATDSANGYRNVVFGSNSFANGNYNLLQGTSDTINVSNNCLSTGVSNFTDSSEYCVNTGTGNFIKFANGSIIACGSSDTIMGGSLGLNVLYSANIAGTGNKTIGNSSVTLGGIGLKNNRESTVMVPDFHIAGITFEDIDDSIHEINADTCLYSITKGTIYVQSHSAGNADLDTIISTVPIGTRIKLVGYDDTKTVTINDSQYGILLNNGVNYTLKKNYQIVLWLNRDGIWQEDSRSDNKFTP